MTDKPLYQHDCERCRFLGSYRAHDLYFCKKERPEVLARYGNDGPDYISGFEFAPRDLILARAVSIVEELNLLGTS